MIELPDNIKNSRILTKTQLQQLEESDDSPIVDAAFEDNRVSNIFQYYSLEPDELETELHKYAAELLIAGNVNAAWQVLLSTNLI